jgi:hypothetical protein
VTAALHVFLAKTATTFNNLTISCRSGIEVSQTRNRFQITLLKEKCSKIIFKTELSVSVSPEIINSD